jgi:hypothetical protein
MRALLIAFLLLPSMALAQDDTPAWLRDDPKPAAHVAAPPRVQSQPMQEAPPDDAKQPLIGTNPQQPIPPERVPRAYARQPVRVQQTYANDFPPHPQQPLVASVDDTDDPDTPQPVAERSTAALAVCPPVDLPNPNWTGAIIYTMNPQKEICIPCRNLDRMLLAAGCTLGTFKKNPGANFIHVYLKNKDAFVRRNLVQAPTIIFFVNGEEDGRESGFEGTQEEIKAIIAKHPMSRAIRNAKALLRSVGETDDTDYPPNPADDNSGDSGTYHGYTGERAAFERRRDRENTQWVHNFAQSIRDREWDAYRYGGTQSSTKYGGTQSAYRYGGTQSAYRYGGTQAAYQYGGTQSSWPTVSYASPAQTFVSSSAVYPQYAQSYGSGNMVCGPNGCCFVR